MCDSSAWPAVAASNNTSNRSSRNNQQEGQRETRSSRRRSRSRPPQLHQALDGHHSNSCVSEQGTAAGQVGVGGQPRRTMVKTFQAYLPPQCHRTYSCIHCRAHLANHDELISKSFQGSQGRAYLFNSVVNVGCGPAEERVLLTGLHAVADIYCECCKTTLGWKYEHAFESSQKYKEGKFIIELAHMIKENGWD
ncbi:protein yippee-like 2 isoform X2 [Aethina tumida]|uniref:protein yippee-like 2 isoform X2 n=1 Tax=Aethina tumida TaxID=116153 RepID=UPI002148763B|nr:protein yippee-like 2 isoform X2 [Aethina tumida]